MIFHNRYLSITDRREMGQYTFDNLTGFEDFSSKALAGDIIITGKNFGSGSSRQQAVDCFISLGIQGIVAESFGAIYERNAINAAFPIITCKSISEMELKSGYHITIDLLKGILKFMKQEKASMQDPFPKCNMKYIRMEGFFNCTSYLSQTCNK